jgi:hypothetical protein
MANAPLRLGAYHMIGDNNWEPQRTNNFEVQFPNLGDLTTIDQGIALPTNASELLTLSVKSVSYPSTSVGKLTVSYGNNSINFAGKPEYGDVTIVVNDFIGIQTERILMGWHKRVYDPKNETIGWASQYKRDGYLFEYSPDGTVVRRTQLRGCFPGNVEPGDFDNDNNEIRQISVTFYVDVAIPLD